MNIILLNGPPRCGKDTAARHFVDTAWFNVKFDRMSMPIKRAFAGTVNSEVDEWGNVPVWEDYKDRPSAVLDGKSYRQWQIEFSEKFMKPLYGRDIFGKLFAERCKSLRPGDTVIVPDCGFDIELRSIAQYLPSARVLLVRILRDGTNFALDSRTYLDPPFGTDYRILSNNGLIEDFEAHSVGVFARWIEQGEHRVDPS